MNDNDRPVYSTDVGRVCPDCGQPAADCTCGQEEEQPPAKGPVTLHVDRSGRRGRTVTIIGGLPLPHNKLQKLAKALKRRCGSGGTAQNGVIEIQGDRRATLISELTARGYEVRDASG